MGESSTLTLESMNEGRGRRGLSDGDGEVGGEGRGAPQAPKVGGRPFDMSVDDSARGALNEHDHQRGGVVRGVLMGRCGTGSHEAQRWHRSVGRQEHVVRSHPAVDEATDVECFEESGDGNADGPGLAVEEPAPGREEIAEGARGGRLCSRRNRAQWSRRPTRSVGHLRETT